MLPAIRDATKARDIVANAVEGGTAAFVTALISAVGGNFATVPLVLILFGSALGKTAGGIFGRIATNVLDFARGQPMTSREEQRVAEVALWAAAELAILEARGERLRDDISDDDSTSQASLLEGVLRMGRTAYEGKHARHIGIFWARVCASRTVDFGLGHHVLRQAEGLSYRQICLLSLFAHPQVLVRYDFRSRNQYLRSRSQEEQSGYEADEPKPDMVAVLQEALHLSRIGMVDRDDSTAILDWSDIRPGGMRLTEFGKTTAYLLGVEHCLPDDLADAIRIINRAGGLWDARDGAPPHERSGTR